MYHPRNTSSFINYFTALLFIGFIPSTLTISVDKPVNFQDDQLGLYSKKDFKKDWGMQPTNSSGQPEGRLAIVADPTYGKVLQVTYLAGKIGGDSGMVFTPTIQAKKGTADSSVKYRHLFFQYRVKFPLGFTWVKGGKLPGLTSSPDSPTGCIDEGTFDGFTMRVMWRENGIPFTYLYNPGKKERCGDYYTFNPTITFMHDTWYTLTQEVYLNTPGASDGYLKQWVNDTLVLDLQGVKLRNAGTIYIDQVKMDSFFGGGSLNWAPATNQHAYFANFIVSETNPLQTSSH